MHHASYESLGHAYLWNYISFIKLCIPIEEKMFVKIYKIKAPVRWKQHLVFEIMQNRQQQTKILQEVWGPLAGSLLFSNVLICYLTIKDFGTLPYLFTLP